MNKIEYLNAIRDFIVAYQKLRKYFAIENCTPAEYAEKMSRLFDDLSHDWTVGLEEIYKIWGIYSIRTDIPEKLKQKTWENLSAHLTNITALAHHHDFICEQQTTFEQLLASLEMEPAIPKEISIRSDPGELPHIENFLKNLTEEWNTPTMFGKIQQATTEAVNNAILHGNEKDLTKKVKITACLHESKIIITVKDEGPGFDYSHLPLTLPDNDQETGRGLFMIKQLTDDMQFAGDGSEIILSFIL